MSSMNDKIEIAQALDTKEKTNEEKEISSLIQEEKSTTSGKGIVIMMLVLIGIFALFIGGSYVYNKLTSADVVNIDQLHEQNLEEKLDEETGYVYNGYSFVKADGLWWTEIHIREMNLNIPLHFGPKEVEFVPMKGTMDPAFNIGENMYIAIDPTTADKYYTLATSELSFNIAKGINRIPVGSCTEENYICENRTIVSCENTQGKPVVELALAEETRIDISGTCIKVSGSENIPQKGPFILCPNHSSYLDVPLLVAAMGYRALLFTFFLGYRAYLEHPFLRWSKQLFRLIPIDPAAHVADTLTMCSYVLRNKKALCLFPEGIRSIDGEIQEFKRGIGILIKELQVDAVPVYIRGAYEAWPPYTMFPSFGKIEVVFGRPASSEALGSSKGETIDMYQNIADNLRARLICLKEGTYV